MHKISINSDQYALPQHWNEITEPQFRAIVEVITEAPTYPEALLYLFFRFTGIRVMQKPHATAGLWILVSPNQKSKIKNQKYYSLATWQLVELSSCLSWIFTQIEKTDNESKIEYSVNCRLIRNLLPSLPGRGWGRGLYGPSAALTNLRFSEYQYAETAHSKYIDTGNEEYLDEMIAVLYRPRRWFRGRWSGDPRRKFNPFLTEKYRAKITRHLSPVTKKMILMWYQACTLHLQRRFPDMYSRGGGTSKVKVFESFNDMVNSLSGDDVTKVSAVRDAYLYDALKTINEMVRRNNELKKQLKKRS